MTGISRFGPPNGNKVVLFNMVEPVQPLDINTLHNIYVVEELIQLRTESNAEIIANSHWTEDLT